MFLDDKEITKLTGIRRPQKIRRYREQVGALSAMGIHDLVRGDGSLVVSRCASPRGLSEARASIRSRRTDGDARYSVTYLFCIGPCGCRSSARDARRYRLPDMDGYQLCERVRREPFGSGMLLVAVTAYGRQEDVQRALAAGFDIHRLKPPDVSELAAMLQEYSAQRQDIDGKC